MTINAKILNFQELGKSCKTKIGLLGIISRFFPHLMKIHQKGKVSRDGDENNGWSVKSFDRNFEKREKRVKKS